MAEKSSFAIRAALRFNCVIYGAKADLDKWMSNSSFQSIKAVKDKHVLVVNDEIWALGKGPLSGEEILKEAIPFFTK
ncbi:hypothetical protein AB4Z30_15370 [Paenibacillus sp. 2TAF8]|jgi:iron complex transport system substrate-binding protein|uniref:hypothetical protein n=1 Tax=Paenibacillus sp. 2TAF8 TaxID=3233020 RepID=UPI003F97C7DD